MDAFRQIDEKLAGDNAIGRTPWMAKSIQVGGRDETTNVHFTSRPATTFTGA
jgi:hypothetical protein